MQTPITLEILWALVGALVAIVPLLATFIYAIAKRPTWSNVSENFITKDACAKNRAEDKLEQIKKGDKALFAIPQSTQTQRGRK